MSSPRVIGAGRFLALLDDGGWEFCHRTRGTAVVGIVAHTADTLVLVEQHRPAVGGPVIEIPAGLVGDHDGDEGEAILDAARRELVEETGFTADSWSSILTGPVSAGLTDEQVTLLRATGLTRVATGGGDASESIVVHEVPLAQVAGFLRTAVARGAKVDPKVLVALWVAGTPWDGGAI